MGAKALLEPGVGTVEWAAAVRTEDEFTGVEVVRLEVVAAEADLDEVRCEGSTVGYIHRVGRVFVALSGTRRDRAEECGHYLLWDYAAQRLLSGRHVVPRRSEVQRRP